MSRKAVLKYVELKSGHGDSGPAWIAHVVLSKTGRSLYFGRKGLKLIKKGGVSGNCFDMETGAEWWVSGVKKYGLNRHWAGSGKIFIEAGAVDEYLQLTGQKELDKKNFQVVPDFEPPDIARFHELENKLSDPAAYAELVERHLNAAR
ncbi:MAG: hypothetical protein ABFD69_10975 [Candidatus Sumerlaeia bacterium]